MGLQKGKGGGASEVLPLQKVGGGKSLIHAEGGGTQTFEVVFAWELEVLAIVMVGCKNVHPLKGGGAQKMFTLS